ncbi:MAG: spore coat-associated protein [Solirubrobacteraceae bacterium]|nr:spore coat-associated protein [Solirubrobacteraceae bacterium]
MSRLHVLAAHPRRTLATLAVVLTAVGITVGSGANFTASAANAGNVFATGTLSIANTPGTAVINASGMKPGDDNTGTVDIQNTGTLSGDFKLATANPTGSTALLNQLDLAVADCGVWSGSTAPTCATTTSVYGGKVGALATAALGAYAGGVKHRYRFTVTLPSSTDDTFQGKSAQVDFAWSATQS